MHVPLCRSSLRIQGGFSFASTRLGSSAFSSLSRTLSSLNILCHLLVSIYAVFSGSQSFCYKTCLSGNPHNSNAFRILQWLLLLSFPKRPCYPSLSTRSVIILHTSYLSNPFPSVKKLTDWLIVSLIWFLQLSQYISCSVDGSPHFWQIEISSTSSNPQHGQMSYFPISVMILCGFSNVDLQFSHWYMLSPPLGYPYGFDTY